MYHILPSILEKISRCHITNITNSYNLLPKSRRGFFSLNHRTNYPSYVFIQLRLVHQVASIYWQKSAKSDLWALNSASCGRESWPGSFTMADDSPSFRAQWRLNSSQILDCNRDFFKASEGLLSVHTSSQQVCRKQDGAPKQKRNRDGTNIGLSVYFILVHDYGDHYSIQIRKNMPI